MHMSHRLQDPRSFSTSIIWTPFFQDFNFRFFQNFDLWLFGINLLHLRIAMMAQAVSPCNPHPQLQGFGGR